MKRKKLTKKQGLLDLKKQLSRLSVESLTFMRYVVSESAECLDCLRYKSEDNKIGSVGICFCVNTILRKIAFNGMYKKESVVFQDVHTLLIPSLRLYALIMHPKKICPKDSDEGLVGLWFVRTDNDIRIDLMNSFYEFVGKIIQTKDI